MAKEKAPEYNSEWSDEMIARFLSATQRAGDHNDPDFDAAVYAFRFLPDEIFARYVQLFVEAGKDINANNAQGQSIVAYLRQFERARAFIQALEAAGAV